MLELVDFYVIQIIHGIEVFVHRLLEHTIVEHCLNENKKIVYQVILKNGIDRLGLHQIVLMYIIQAQVLHLVDISVALDITGLEVIV